MNTQDKLQKSRKYEWIVFGAFAVILLAAHAFCTKFGDDLVYEGIWGREPLFQFLQSRYFDWSSRVLLEAVMMPLTAANMWLWRTLDVGMILLFIWSVSCLFGMGRKVKAQIILFVMLWTIPVFSLSSAGWIATTVNYLWPLALGFVGMLPFLHWIKEEDCPLWEKIVCPVCVLFGANMEQMAAILLGAYLVVGVYLLLEQKKLTAFYFVQLGLIMLSVLFILTAPGNSVRVLAETERFFPEFAELSFLEKLWTGFLETSWYFLAAGPEQESIVFGLLAGVLFLQTVLQLWGRRSAMAAEGTEGLQASAELSRHMTKSKVRTCSDTEKWSMGKKLCVCFTALCPLAFYLGIGRLGNFLLDSGILTRGRNGVGVLAQNKYIPGLSYFSDGLVVFQTVCYLAVLVCVLLTLWFIYGKSRETALQSVILCAGFLSKAIVGFSPTVYASGDRTALFGSAAILIVIMRNLLLLGRGSKLVK